MTDFQYELLRFLYYLLMAAILVVKIAFAFLISCMLVDYIVLLLKDIKNSIDK